MLDDDSGDAQVTDTSPKRGRDPFWNPEMDVKQRVVNNNQLWISWRDEAFGEVNLSNALSYFSRSPFASLENPSVSNNKLTSSSPGAAGEVEYVVQDAQSPHLFVIRMQAKSIPLGLYYCLDGTIYACPSLHSVLSSRRKRCGFMVSRSLDLLRKDLNPIDGILSSRPVDMKETIARLEASQAVLSDKDARRDFKGDSILANLRVGG